MKVKKESEKAGLKLNIQKAKIMASGPITSWEIDGETVETMSDFILGGSKITADGDCSHEIKRQLLLRKKVMTNVDSILKAETLLCQQRSIWSRLWFFQWSCMDVRVRLWRKLSAEKMMLLNYGVGEDSWESLGLQGDPTSPSWGDKSWLFIGRADVETETPILWPPHAKSWLVGKDSHAGRDWGQEEKGTTEDEMVGWHHQLNGHVWVNLRSWWWTGRPGMLRFMGSQRAGHDWATEVNWTESNTDNIMYNCTSTEGLSGDLMLSRTTMKQLRMTLGKVNIKQDPGQCLKFLFPVFCSSTVLEQYKNCVIVP